MSKFWHIFATIGMSAAVVLVPIAQHAVVTHPVIGGVLGAGWAILGNILKSPTQQ